MAVTVLELISKLEQMPAKAIVFLEGVGDPMMGSEQTGFMGYGEGDDVEVEDVRVIEGGVRITTY